MENIKEKIVLTSPYFKNNLMLLIEKFKNPVEFHIFKFVWDPSESEFIHLNSFERFSKLETPLFEEITIHTIIPGRETNELIVITDNGKVWTAKYIKAKFILTNKIATFNKDDYESVELAEIANIIPYFTKKSNKLAGIIFKEIEESFFIILNKDNFPNIEEEQYLIEFENSIPIFTAEKHFLKLYFYNVDSKDNGIISFPENKTNQEFVISIRNLPPIESKPIQISFSKDSLFILTHKEVIVYPDYLKRKFNKVIPLPNDLAYLWVEQYYQIVKIVDKLGYVYSFSLFPLMRKISPKKISQISSIPVGSHYSLGNHQAGLFLQLNNLSYWRRKKHYSTNNHEILFGSVKLRSRSALEALKRMEEINPGFCDLMQAETKIGIPQALLIKKRKRKRLFAKSEDIFIIQNAYNGLSSKQIAKHLKRGEMSISIHLCTVFGTPSCENHNRFRDYCIDCKEEYIKWKSKAESIIEGKTYKYNSYSDEEIEKWEYDEIEQNKGWHTRSNIKNLLYLFQDDIPDSISSKIYEFLISSDYFRGRSIKHVFSNTLRIFIEDEIYKLDLKCDKIPFDLLDIYFNINSFIEIDKKLDFALGSELLEAYKKEINPSFRQIGTKKLIYKDLYCLYQITDENLVYDIIPYLKPFYRRFKKGIHDGLLGAVYKLAMPRKHTQTYLSEIWNITEVTLRARIKEIKKMINFKAFEKLKKIIQNWNKNSDIIDTIIDESV